MQTNKKNISKELIIETTLVLIEENDGMRDVNLRGIAKRIGCNHTNLYNYFNSLDEIFWESLGQAISNMVEYSDSNLDKTDDLEEKLYLLLANMIDFSFQHASWYRLIWLDNIKGEPSSEVFEVIKNAGEKFNEKILKACSNRINKKRAEEISDILFGYLNGEICKWISHRGFEDSAEKVKTKILLNLKRLYKLLIQEVDNL
ncbi:MULTISPECIES: TetR/AcrR family transcriptional regulator [unclassified Clostridium]|uniref:TetR/AcrR family transcriptional regulator n=1 Tax=unclassified Clostridium TaxID=2614128 RepID=UPI0002973010|nr:MULTISPECIES: TetR/AcrR family transcriptional regulator [unclassified Clostridium]EKQ55504.1 MAG: transcriptional regulator [Clostridium sp. Maddingley MBC34-26]